MNTLPLTNKNILPHMCNLLLLISARCTLDINTNLHFFNVFVIVDLRVTGEVDALRSRMGYIKEKPEVIHIRSTANLLPSLSQDGMG